MSLTIKSRPALKYHSAGNPVEYELKTDRLKEVETSFTVSSISSDVGFLKLTLPASPAHDIKAGDIVTLSGFSVVAFNAKHEVSAVTATTIKLTTVYQAATLTSAKVIRTNDNFFVSFNMGKGFEFIQSPTSYDTDGYALFKMDLSDALKTYLSTDYYQGSNIIEACTNSQKTYILYCTEYYFDKSNYLKQGDQLDNVAVYSTLDAICELMTLNDNESISDYLYDGTGVTTKKFLTDNNYQRFDFTNLNAAPQLQLIYSGSSNLSGNIQAVVYDKAGTTLQTYTVGAGLTAYTRSIINVKAIMAALTYSNFVNAYKIIITYLGSGNNISHTFYNETRKTKKPAFINYLNRLGAFDYYQFADEEISELSNKSTMALNNRVWKKDFNQVDNKSTLSTYKEGNIALPLLAQMLYSTKVYYGTNASVEEVVIENDNFTTYSNEVQETRIDIKKKRLLTW